MTPRPALSDFDTGSLASLLSCWGFKRSHAQKILHAYHASAGCVDSSTLDRLSIPQDLQRRLSIEISGRSSRIGARHDSADGTTKLLVEFDRKGAVETVLMPSHRHDRAAGCLSSQIGCAMGCDFCASTKNGLERDLSAGEIVEQFLHLKSITRQQGRRIASIVFMGMGEPLLNLDAVADAVRRITDPRVGNNLGPRMITISTVGVIPGIRRLTELNLGVHLAVSLHSADDATRGSIVPTARKWTVAEIIAAARDFAEETGRYVTIEYTLLAGVNDSDEQAVLLAGVLGDFRAHVNLIPYNPIGPGLSGTTYRRPPASRMEQFARILSARGVVSHFRQTRGDDVAAACGQLRVLAAL